MPKHKENRSGVRQSKNRANENSHRDSRGMSEAGRLQRLAREYAEIADRFGIEPYNGVGTKSAYHGKDWNGWHDRPMIETVIEL